ncbi:MAG: hypothetical protein L0287_30495, partial [Anaerolineae bacterium]|nr:hypothetical protein [Anaerolineae bacterium]
KRTDTAFSSYLDPRHKRLTIGAGRYKAFHMPVFVRSALYLDWFCVGDADRLNELVSTVTHIGKKRSQGWGRVIRWQINQTDRDYHLFMHGRLMRGVPKSFPIGSAQHQVAYFGFRPCYWKKSNQDVLKVPVIIR